MTDPRGNDDSFGHSPRDLPADLPGDLPGDLPEDWAEDWAERGEDHGAPSGTDGDRTDDPVIVKAPLMTRFTVTLMKLFVLLVAPLICAAIVLQLGGRLSVAQHITDLAAIGVALLALIVAPTIVAIGWPIRMALHANRLRLGGRLLGRWVKYDDVLVIDVDNAGSGRARITLDLGITRPRIKLNDVDAVQVIPALQSLCPRAALWDADGSVHLSDDEEYTIESAHNVRALGRRRAMGALALGGFALLGAIMSLAPILNGTVGPGRLIGMIVMCIFGISEIYKSFAFYRSGNLVVAAVTEPSDWDFELEDSHESDVDDAQRQP